MSFKKNWEGYGEGGDFKGDTAYLLKAWIVLRDPEWFWLGSNKSLAFLETSRPVIVGDWLNFDYFV